MVLFMKDPAAVDTHTFKNTYGFGLHEIERQLSAHFFAFLIDLIVHLSSQATCHTPQEGVPLLCPCGVCLCVMKRLPAAPGSALELYEASLHILFQDPN